MAKMFEDAKNSTSNFTPQYNPTTYGPNVGGFGKWTGLSGIGARNEEKYKYNHMSADDLRNHQFSPLLSSSLSAINASDSLGHDFPAYKAAIVDTINKGDTEKLYAILQELVKRQNIKYPDSARILDINEPYPAEWATEFEERSRKISQGTKAKASIPQPSWDDRKNGFWVPIRAGSTTPEAKAIEYITKGITLDGFWNRSSAFSRASKNAKEISKGVYDAAGITADSMYTLINSAESMIVNNAGSPRDQYKVMGKLLAQLEVLKDSGDTDTVNKIKGNIDLLYNKVQGDDIRAQTYINIFMSKYYIEYCNNYPETMIRSNPDIARKKDEATKYLSSSDTFWATATMEARKGNYNMTTRMLGE